MKYIYHIHAIYQNNANYISHFDGIIDSNMEILEFDQYREMKRNLAAAMDLPSDNIIVQSLTLLKGQK